MATTVPRKDRVIQFKVTADQARIIGQRAKKCGMHTGAWIRHIVMQAASRPSDGRYMRIREPNGATT